MRKNIIELVAIIDSPSREICHRIIEDNKGIFETAPGSSHNHHAWPGGYIDHVEEVMHIACDLYETLGRRRPLGFSLSDALLIMFLHDLEKMWRFKIVDNGDLQKNTQLETKDQREAFRVAKLKEYGLILTPDQANALKYVEGEHKDYSSKQRAMGPLAAFCHMCDVWSARGWFDYPLMSKDPWIGAVRYINR